MMRILLGGILILAALAAITAAIVMLAPYIAFVSVVAFLGWVLLRFGDDDDQDKPP